MQLINHRYIFYSHILTINSYCLLISLYWNKILNNHTKKEMYLSESHSCTSDPLIQSVIKLFWIDKLRAWIWNSRSVSSSGCRPEIIVTNIIHSIAAWVIIKMQSKEKIPKIVRVNFAADNHTEYQWVRADLVLFSLLIF